MKVLLKVMYRGENYAGFQVQPNAETVQGRLCEATKRLMGYRCDICGCSRTDSGVHALGFVCSVAPHGKNGFGEGEFTVPISRVHRAVNAFLPDDISVIGACSVEDSFHPRYDVRGKEYVYRIFHGAVEDPFEVGRSMRYPYSLTDEMIAEMSRCAKLFVGKHDFRGFMSAGSSVESTVRNVSFAEVSRKGKYAEFTVYADGFLYNMVRIMAGTLLECAVGKKSGEDILSALSDGDRGHLGFTAPARGLYLSRVDYNRELHFEAE